MFVLSFLQSEAFRRAVQKYRTIYFSTDKIPKNQNPRTEVPHKADNRKQNKCGKAAERRDYVFFHKTDNELCRTDNGAPDGFAVNQKAAHATEQRKPPHNAVIRTKNHEYRGGARYGAKQQVLKKHRDGVVAESDADNPESVVKNAYRRAQQYGYQKEHTLPGERNFNIAKNRHVNRKGVAKSLFCRRRFHDT